MVQRAFGAMTNETLLSIPLFVLMGYVMERGALVDKMFHSVQLAFRRVPGSLAVATLIICTFWGIASGLVGAVVVLMGVIAMRPMLNAGYDTRLAAGVITAGGTLGILIPPSVMIIVYAAVAGQSVVKLYAAAMFPGFFLALLYLVYVIGWALLQPEGGAQAAARAAARADLAVGRARRRELFAAACCRRCCAAVLAPARALARRRRRACASAGRMLLRSLLQRAGRRCCWRVVTLGAVWWYVTIYSQKDDTAPRPRRAARQAAAPAAAAATRTSRRPAACRSRRGAGGLQEPPRRRRPAGAARRREAGAAGAGRAAGRERSRLRRCGGAGRRPPHTAAGAARAFYIGFWLTCAFVAAAAGLVLLALRRRAVRDPVACWCRR